MAKHNLLGKQGEDMAERLLHDKGYTIVERDWHSGKRDIDIIARTPDGVTWVFVEVKTRTSDDLVSPLDAIDITNIRHIGASADHYIKMHHIDAPTRFDVITVVGQPGANAKIDHIEDAFNPLMAF